MPLLNTVKIKNEMKINIESFISKIANKYKISKRSMKRWKTRFIKHINDKIDQLVRMKQWDRPILGDRASKNELDRLKSLYVITVVDKAAGNFAFTCKKFYSLCFHLM